MKIFNRTVIWAVGILMSVVLCGLFSQNTYAAIKHSGAQNKYETEAPLHCGPSTGLVGFIYFNGQPDDYHKIGISVYNVSDPANVPAYLHSFSYVCPHGATWVGDPMKAKAFYNGAPVAGLGNTDPRIKFVDPTLCSIGSYACFDFGIINSTSPGNYYDAVEVVPLKLDLTNEIAAHATDIEMLVCASYYGTGHSTSEGCDYSPIELYYDPVHRVRFFDCDGELIWEEAVDLSGGAAYGPPLCEGAEWDKDFNNITGDTDIHMINCGGGTTDPDPDPDPKPDPKKYPGPAKAGVWLTTLTNNPYIVATVGLSVLVVVAALSRSRKSAKK